MLHRHWCTAGVGVIVLQACVDEIDIHTLGTLHVVDTIRHSLTRYDVHDVYRISDDLSNTTLLLTMLVVRRLTSLPHSIVSMKSCRISQENHLCHLL